MLTCSAAWPPDINKAAPPSPILSFHHLSILSCIVYFRLWASYVPYLFFIVLLVTLLQFGHHALYLVVKASILVIQFRLGGAYRFITCQPRKQIHLALVNRNDQSCCSQSLFSYSSAGPSPRPMASTSPRSVESVRQ